LPELIVTPTDDPVKVYPNTETKVTVCLPAAPKNTVTVKVTSEQADSGITFSTKALKFTKKNWNVPQEIVVKCAEGTTENTMVLDARGYELAVINFIDPPVIPDDPPVFVPTAEDFVGVWSEHWVAPSPLPGIPNNIDQMLVYSINADGTCDNLNTDGSLIRSGTWTFSNGTIDVTWADGNYATLTFTDANNITGIGCGYATITLVRQ